ncbi:MAG: hypothetical protein NVSMB57_04450 [Actinomycetota bacterium]
MELNEPRCESVVTTPARPDGIARVHVLGVDLAQVTRSRLSRYAIDALETEDTTLLYAMHVVGINILGEHPAYERALSNADLVHADGTSVLLAVRAAGYRLPERIATQDFLYDVIAHCAAHAHPIFLLGGPKGLARAAADTLAARYPGLQVAGARDGFFDDAHGNEIAEQISRSGAHLLLVGMGCPREQVWSNEHGKASKTRLLMTVGGTFGYIVGDEKRAPKLVQKTSTEWLWRLAQDPRRLAKRYLGGIPKLTRQVRRARAEARR